MTTLPKKPTYEQERDAAADLAYGTDRAAGKQKGVAFKLGASWGRQFLYHDDEVIADLSHRLHRAILALDVALDDTGDQYYGNVRDQAKEALAAFTAEKERLK